MTIRKSNSESKRIISVVLEVHDMDQAKTFWDSHSQCRNILGCRILGLSEGNLMEECERLEEKVWKYDELSK